MDQHQMVRKGMYVRRITYNPSVFFTVGEVYKVLDVHRYDSGTTGLSLKDDVGMESIISIRCFELIVDRDTASLLLS